MTDDLTERLLGDVHIACEHPAEPCIICRNTLEAADRIEQLEAVVNHPIIQICIGMNALRFPELVAEVQL